MTTLAELASSRELMVNLTLRELRGKYKRSALGWIWSLVNPLATMFMFAVVFRVFLRIEPPVGDPSGLHFFAFFLLCGLLSWNYLANSISGSIGALLGNANLIKKVYFPRQVLVGANVASWLVSFLVEMAVLVIALLFVGNVALMWIPAALLLVVIQTVFLVGIGLALSVLNVYFRDVQHFVGIGLQLWFYATPIIYPVTLVPQRVDLWGADVPLRRIYDLNPMVHIVEGFRDCFYHLRFPSLGGLAYAAAAAAVSLAVGWWVFAKLEFRLAEEL